MNDKQSKDLGPDRCERVDGCRQFNLNPQHLLGRGVRCGGLTERDTMVEIAVARDLHGVQTSGGHDLGVTVRGVLWGDRRHQVAGRDVGV